MNMNIKSISFSLLSILSCLFSANAQVTSDYSQIVDLRVKGSVRTDPCIFKINNTTNGQINLGINKIDTKGPLVPISVSITGCQNQKAKWQKVYLGNSSFLKPEGNSIRLYNQSAKPEAKKSKSWVNFYKVNRDGQRQQLVGADKLLNEWDNHIYHGTPVDITRNLLIGYAQLESASIVGTMFTGTEFVSSVDLEFVFN